MVRLILNIALILSLISLSIHSLLIFHFQATQTDLGLIGYFSDTKPCPTGWESSWITAMPSNLIACKKVIDDVAQI